MAGSYISGDSITTTNNTHNHNHHLPNEHYEPILALTTTTNNSHVTTDTWQVQYAHFFNCPADVSSSGRRRHPSLVPHMKRNKGTWLSSFTSLAYLRLFTDCGGDYDDDCGRVVLTVTLVDHVVEEHYISKLHFTWPQVACLSGFPARGSKVVFMSYKDRVGQIHKFAVRFVTLYETERFINSIKEFFGQEKIDGSVSGISITRTSSHSEIIPRAPQDWDPISSSANFSQPMYRAPQDWDPLSSSADFSQPIYRPPQNGDPVKSSADFDQPMYRPTWEWSPIASTADTCIQSMQPSENHNSSQNANPMEATLSQDVQGKLSAFPPSFTSLLMDCFPAAEQEMQSTVPEEVALKKEIMKYLEDSSFHEMLSKVQKVVNGFEDDLLVQPVTTL
ncbi:PHS1-like protein [Artemisia annua]|uniref:PHS1-like protein n=1 Tax=Artemisia annua TaxID=35608 RepID=A0A2U1M5M2_ARTAN|nr:PHS1-like protein [Artemisia annua]